MIRRFVSTAALALALLTGLDAPTHAVTRTDGVLVVDLAGSITGYEQAVSLNRTWWFETYEWSGKGVLALTTGVVPLVDCEGSGRTSAAISDESSITTAFSCYGPGVDLQFQIHFFRVGTVMVLDGTSTITHGSATYNVRATGVLQWTPTSAALPITSYRLDGPIALVDDLP